MPLKRHLRDPHYLRHQNGVLLEVDIPLKDAKTIKYQEKSPVSISHPT